MKHLLFFLLVLGAVFSTNSDLHSQQSNKVLLFIRDGSGDLEFTLKTEVAVMKEMHERIPNSTLKIIDKAGHGSPRSRAPEINSMIIDFLKK